MRRKIYIPSLVVRIGLGFVALLLLLNSIIQLQFSQHLGVYLELGIGVVVAVYAGFWDRLPVFRIVTAVLTVFFAFFVAMSIFLLAYGSDDDVTYGEDYLIVLGAGLHGENLSTPLADRLAVAVRYYQQNPAVIIVVSGGQGPSETLPEATVMAQYLKSYGIPDRHILKEYKSTSTEENLTFSKDIILNQNNLSINSGSDLSVGVISNDFHIYRAEELTRRVFADATTDIHHLHTATMLFELPSDLIRESLAVIKTKVFG